MTHDPDYPSFDEALRRFHGFLRSRGSDRELSFIDAGNLLVVDGHWYVRRSDPVSHLAAARDRYEAAVVRRLGVSVVGQCVVDATLAVSVDGPSDSDESERLMYPDGLKLSIVEPIRDVTVLDAADWLALRAKRGRSGWGTTVDPSLLK